MRQFRQLAFATFMFVALGLAAQAPAKINYQAVARNGSGNLLANTAIKVRYSVRDASATGTIQYRETHTAITTNQFGLFTAAIGGGTPSQGTFGAITWATGDKYLQVEIDVNNSGTFADLGTSQLVSVPYALFAANSPAGVTGPKGDTGAKGDTGPAGTGTVSGTTNFVAKFTPNGTTAGNSLIFDNGSQLLVGTSVVPATSPKLTINQTGIGSAGHFNIGNSGSSSNALFAQTNGTGFALETGAGNVHFTNDVAIGTTTPQNKLHAAIASTSTSNFGPLYLENTLNGNVGIIFAKDGGIPVGSVGWDQFLNSELAVTSNNGRDVGIRANSASATALIKLKASTGYVGVNTGNPNSTLEVNGTFACKTVGAASLSSGVGTGTILPDAYFIELDAQAANARFRLPVASTCKGRMYVFYNTGANTAVIERSGTDNLFSGVGAMTTTFSMPVSGLGRMVHVLSDGNNWIWGIYQ